MNPDAIGPLLAMQQATTIHDAHGHAVDAVKAGASSDEVSQAITEWMAVQAAQVQQVFTDNRRPDCCTGVDRDHTDLPPYTREPLTTEDGLAVVGWGGPVPSTAPRCKCSHIKSNHGTDRRGRAICRSAACGCASYRPQADPPAIPARWDERYDPSPEPINRSVQ